MLCKRLATPELQQCKVSRGGLSPTASPLDHHKPFPWRSEGNSEMVKITERTPNKKRAILLGPPQARLAGNACTRFMRESFFPQIDTVHLANTSKTHIASLQIKHNKCLYSLYSSTPAAWIGHETCLRSTNCGTKNKRLLSFVSNGGSEPFRGRRVEEVLGYSLCPLLEVEMWSSGRLLTIRCFSAEAWHRLSLPIWNRPDTPHWLCGCTRPALALKNKKRSAPRAHKTKFPRSLWTYQPNTRRRSAGSPPSVHTYDLPHTEKLLRRTSNNTKQKSERRSARIGGISNSHQAEEISSTATFLGSNRGKISENLSARFCFNLLDDRLMKGQKRLRATNKNWEKRELLSNFLLYAWLPGLLRISLRVRRKPWHANNNKRVKICEFDWKWKHFIPDKANSQTAQNTNYSLSGLNERNQSDYGLIQRRERQVDFHKNKTRTSTLKSVLER